MGGGWVGGWEGVGGKWGVVGVVGVGGGGGDGGGEGGGWWGWGAVEVLGVWWGWRGGGGGWEAEGGLHLPLGHRQWCCVFSKGQIQVQSTE